MTVICKTPKTLTTGIVVQDKNGVNIDADVQVRLTRGLTAAGLRPVYEVRPFQLYRADSDELIDLSSLGEGYLDFAKNEAELLVSSYKDEVEGIQFQRELDKTLAAEPR